MRALATAPAIGMVVAVLAMLVWRRQGADTDSAAEPVDADDAAPVCPLGFSRKVVSALVVGTVAAEAAWALLYWPAPAPVAALALLVVFYVSAGLLGATERRSLSWPLATEYLVTGALALAAVIWAVLRVR